MPNGEVRPRPEVLPPVERFEFTKSVLRGDPKWGALWPKRTLRFLDSFAEMGLADATDLGRVIENGLGYVPGVDLINSFDPLGRDPLRQRTIEKAARVRRNVAEGIPSEQWGISRSPSTLIEGFPQIFGEKLPARELRAFLEHEYSDRPFAQQLVGGAIDPTLGFGGLGKAGFLGIARIGQMGVVKAATARTMPEVVQSLGRKLSTLPSMMGRETRQPILGAVTMSDLQSFDDLAKVAFQEDNFRALAAMPGFRSVTAHLNPAALAEDPVSRAYVGGQALLVQGQQKAAGAFAHLRRLGTQEEVFGKLDERGLFADGPLRGKAPNDVRTWGLTNPGDFKLKPQQREWIQQAERLEAAKLDLLQRNGIDIKELTFSRGGHYAGRRVYVRIIDDDVVDTQFLSGGVNKPGQKLHAEEARHFETQKEAIEAGYRYLPEDEALFLNIQGAYNRIAEKSAGDWLFSRPSVQWRAAEGPEALHLALYGLGHRGEKANELGSLITDIRNGKKEIPDSRIDYFKDVFADKAEEVEFLDGLRTLRDDVRLSTPTAAARAADVPIPAGAADAEEILPSRVHTSILRIRAAVDEGIETYRRQGPRRAEVGGIPESEIPTGWRAGVDPQLESMGMRRPLPIEDVDIGDAKLEVAMEARADRLDAVAREMEKRGVKVPRDRNDFAKTDIYGEIEAVQRANTESGRRANVLLFDAIARRHGGKSIANEFDILDDVMPSETGGRLDLDRLSADWDTMGQPEVGIAATRDAAQVIDEVDNLLYATTPSTAARGAEATPVVRAVSEELIPGTRVTSDTILSNLSKPLREYSDGQLRSMLWTRVRGRAPSTVRSKSPNVRFYEAELAKRKAAGVVPQKELTARAASLRIDQKALVKSIGGERAKINKELTEIATVKKGEAEVTSIPLFKGKILEGPNALNLKEDIIGAFTPEGVPGLLTSVNKAGAVVRFLKLGGDMSLGGIQLLFLAGYKPKAYGSAMKGFVMAFMDTSYHADYLARNNDIVQKSTNLLLSGQGGTEFTEAMGRAGMLSSGRLKIAGDILRPFQRGFEAGLDIAGIEMKKSLQSLATDPHSTAQVDDFINEFRGLASSKKLGASARVREAESLVLLAPRYNRAVAALLADLFRGNLRGQLARTALARGIGAITVVATVYTAARGLREGKTKEAIYNDVVDILNPASPKFMLWEVAGQMVGPGTKVRSVLALLGDTIEDPESLLELSMKNPAFRFARGQLGPVPSTGIDTLTGRTFLGDPVWGAGKGVKQGAFNFTKNVVAENMMPIWMQSVTMEGGSVGQRLSRGGAEFYGARAFPQGIAQILNHQSPRIMKKRFDKTESFEKHLLSGLLKDRIDPLTQQDIERGRELSEFFDRLDQINLQEAMHLREAVSRNASGFQISGIQNRYRGMRMERGLDQEFEPGSINDKDPIKSAMAQRSALFDDPRLKTPSGMDINWHMFEAAEKFLRDNYWTEEQKEGVLRNTNMRPIPKEVLFAKGFPSQKRASILASHEARVRYLARTGRSELIGPLQRWYFMENLDFSMQQQREEEVQSVPAR
jgi:hypothetical protein